MDALKADLPAWGEKFVRTTLGGMEAEKLHLEQAGFARESEHPAAWSQDLWVACGCLNDMIGLGLTVNADVEAELARVQSVVRSRLEFPGLWAAVEAIAGRLLVDLAIGGSTARELFLAGRTRPGLGFPTPGCGHGPAVPQRVDSCPEGPRAPGARMGCLACRPKCG
jgi:hypothetical protein